MLVNLSRLDAASFVWFAILVDLIWKHQTVRFVHFGPSVRMLLRVPCFRALNVGNPIFHGEDVEIGAFCRWFIVMDLSIFILEKAANIPCIDTSRVKLRAAEAATTSRLVVVASAT